MGLSTGKIKEAIAAQITEKDVNAIHWTHGWTDDLELRQLQTVKPWKRTKKFKRPTGEVVRYFSVKTEAQYENEPVCKVITDAADERILGMLFGAVREQKDIYFAFGDNDGELILIATIGDYWTKEGCIDDQSYAAPYLPERYGELMESMFEVPCSKEEARQELLRLGFTEEPKLDHFAT